jgi:hypothetical protein
MRRVHSDLNTAKGRQKLGGRADTQSTPPIEHRMLAHVCAENRQIDRACLHKGRQTEHACTENRQTDRACLHKGRQTEHACSGKAVDERQHGGKT